MKYPILSKFMASFLLVCCLAMLASGIYGMNKAEENREQSRYELSEVRKTAEDFKSLDKALQGQISFEEAEEELDRRRAEHEKAAAEHKKELTEYTAVKGGVSVGSEALDESGEALAEGEIFFQEAMAELEQKERELQEAAPQLKQARAQYDAAEALYEFGVSSVASARQLLDELYSFDDLMEGDSGSANLELCMEFYDRSIAVIEGMQSFMWQLQTEGIISSEQYEAAEDALIAATGMSSSDILDILYKYRDQLYESSGGMGQEQFELIKAAYYVNRDLILNAAFAAEGMLNELQWTLDDKGAELEMMGQQLLQGEAMVRMGTEAAAEARAYLENGAGAIKQGGAAMEAARRELSSKLGELDTQLTDLKKEKNRLRSESEELQELEEEAEEKKELEAEHTRLSLSLRESERIRELWKGGTGLYEAAGIYAGEREKEIEDIYESSRDSCIAMIAAAGAGLIAFIFIFRKNTGRILRLIFPVLCLALCLASEYISLAAGLGHVYSPLTCAVLSLLLILSAAFSRKRGPAAAP